MNNQFKSVVHIVLLVLSIQIHAQNADNPLPKWAFIANVGHQDQGFDISFGSLQVIHKVPFRPQIAVGIERTWVNRNKFRLFQDLQASYFHDSYVEKVYGLTTDVGFEFKIFRGLRLTPRIGVGYNSAKANDVRYKYEGDKWVQTANTDPAISRLNVKTGLDLSYRFNNTFDVLVGGHFSLVTPYIPNAASIYLYKGWHIGTRVFF